MSKTTDSISSTCVLCCQAIKIYAVGPCDHHVCFKCSTKMRVLCDQKYCAVCRTDMPKVIFTHKLHPYQGIISHKFPTDRKYGISFATSKFQEEFRRLQDHRCPICPARRLPENMFKDLQDHLRKEHEMFFCELCIKHLQVFTHERKCYNRRDLAMHKRKGDPDDTSYRGHPLCEFCDERYFDNDELLKHLRRQHYFCHFCETDGASNQYYNDYDDLKHHFRDEHFLCEEAECGSEKFTHAFRSEIDLKAHKATMHSKNMTRAQARQARQLDIEFSLPPRPRDNRGSGGSGRGHGRRYDRYEGNDTARAVEASIESARKEEETREEELSKIDKKTKKVPKGKDKKVSNSTEGRRNSKQDESGNGKVSPVSLDNSKEGASNKTAKTKTSKDDKKENQRKGKEVSVKLSVESKPEAAATELVTEKKKTDKKKGEDESVLQDFPSLATFKPLVDETVTPSWNEEKTLANVATSLNKEGVKKKKKKKKDVSAASASAGNEEPESGFDLYSGLINDKLLASNEPKKQPQPLWVITSGKNSASSSDPLGAPSTYPKQPPRTWTTNLSANQSQSTSSPWTTSSSTGQRSQPATSTWTAHTPSGNQSRPSTTGTWAEKGSTSDLGDSSDFPTLSSIASLLGGSTSKKTNKNSGSNQKSKKQLDEENKSAKTSTKSWNKVAESERSSPSEVVNKKKSNEQVHTQPEAITSVPRLPPGLTSVPINNPTNRVPPGFGQSPQVHKPPPGFAVSFPLNSAPTDPQLSDYVLPTNYKERNFALLEKIKIYLDHDDAKLMIFKTVSGEFRRNNITPAEYYGHCLDLLGDNLPKIFPELVSLLPDVIKQQELLAAYNDYKLKDKQKKEDKVLRISDSKSKAKASGKASKKAWGNSTEHSTCTQCGQVLLKADLEAHLNSHQDFPSLSASVSTKSKPFMAPTPWAR